MQQSDEIPHLYSDLASWWPLLSDPADYEEEAGIYTRAILGALAESGLSTAAKPTMLELGSGGGNNASFLKRVFDCTLSDRSAGMLAVSRALNPELPHHQGDMRSLRLGQQFDVVFLHDAVMYLTAEDDLRAAFATAYAHTRPGGVFLVCPDFTRETFHPNTEHGGDDGEKLNPPHPGRALRYLEWTYDPDPSDSTYITDFTYILREGSQMARCVTERHLEGIFPRATWLSLLEDTGFVPRAIPFDHSEVEGVTENFLCIRPR
jgi:SAM-dependent methyltransferase